MILKINKLVKNFGGIKAVDKASIKIQEGKITAIIGPNGSGKTTLFNLISSIEKADSGEIHFKDQNITKKRTDKISKLGISRTFQQVRLFEFLTIEDHLSLSISKDDEKLFKTFLKGKVDRSKEMKNIMKLVGLKKPLNTYVSDLSYGQRKLLDLAIALAKEHELIMLDEPVAGVNPKLRGQIKVLLKKLREKGETILLIEHDMTFVMDLADHVIVMDAGKVIVEGKPKQVQKNKKVLEAYLGE